MKSPAPNGAMPRASQSKVFGVVGFGWLVFCVFQFAASLSDQKAIEPDKIANTAQLVLLANLPFALQCWLHYEIFLRLGEKINNVVLIGGIFLLSIPLVFVPTIVFEAAVNPIILGSQPLASLPKQFSEYPAVYWTVDFLLFCGCFAGAYAVCLRRVHAISAQAQVDMARENLELRLALEQQRLATLQAQLEPHFMFNALSSISGLIRLGDKRVALTALSQLSMLLRYAVEVSNLTAVSLAREMAFVRDYLALQSLRFAGRLTVVVSGENTRTNEVLIPPLLLQPLIENAIRHDLERHTEVSDLRIEFELANRVLHVSVSNPMRIDCETNPGLGVGLTHVRNKLQVIYGHTATITTVTIDGRFIVRLTLPEYPDD